MSLSAWRWSSDRTLPCVVWPMVTSCLRSKSRSKPLNEIRKLTIRITMMMMTIFWRRRKNDNSPIDMCAPSYRKFNALSSPAAGRRTGRSEPNSIPALGVFCKMFIRRKKGERH